MRRRIPFFEQPATNDPNINLSQERDIDFYGRMKRKFDVQASALFTSMEEPDFINMDIDLPDECDNIAFFSSFPLKFRRSPLPPVAPTTALRFRSHLRSTSDPLVLSPVPYDSCLVLRTLSGVH